MSTPITTDATIFRSEGFCPGAGVLAIHVPDEYDFDGTQLEDAVKRSTPVCTSYGRPSAQLTKRAVTMVYSVIHLAMDDLYTAWNRHTERKDKTPVASRTFMDRWFKKMKMDKEEVLANLGVAQPGDTIDLGVTPKGGKKLVISTFENHYAEMFRQRIEGLHGNMPYPLLLDLLTDVTILSALGEINRQMMYRQLCHTLGWTTVRAEEYKLSTHSSGIDLTHWEVYASEVRVKDGAFFMLPVYKDSWAVCRAENGEKNIPVPWQVIHNDDECPVRIGNRIHTKVSVTCMPIEFCWCAEYDKG